MISEIDLIIQRFTEINAKLYQKHLSKREFDQILQNYNSCKTLYPLLPRNYNVDEQTSLLHNTFKEADAQIKTLMQKAQIRIDKIDKFFKSQKITRSSNYVSIKNSKTSNPQNLSINTLPPDVLRFILTSFFSLTDTARLRLICKSWNTLIKNTKLSAVPIKMNFANEEFIIVPPDETDMLTLDKQYENFIHTLETNKVHLVEGIKAASHTEIAQNTQSFWRNFRRSIWVLSFISFIIGAGILAYNSYRDETNRNLNIAIAIVLLLLSVIPGIKSYIILSGRDDLPLNLGDNLFNFFKDKIIDKEAESYFAKFRSKKPNDLERVDIENTNVGDPSTITIRSSF